MIVQEQYYFWENEAEWLRKRTKKLSGLLGNWVSYGCHGNCMSYGLMEVMAAMGKDKISIIGKQMMLLSFI